MTIVRQQISLQNHGSLKLVVLRYHLASGKFLHATLNSVGCQENISHQCLSQNEHYLF